MVARPYTEAMWFSTTSHRVRAKLRQAVGDEEDAVGRYTSLGPRARRRALHDIAELDHSLDDAPKLLSEVGRSEHGRAIAGWPVTPRLAKTWLVGSSPDRRSAARATAGCGLSSAGASGDRIGLRDRIRAWSTTKKVLTVSAGAVSSAGLGLALYQMFLA
jgi:hypothetical protein